jgi:tRNA A-37 threonylcarbamoyl transferase component Bud32
MALERVMSYLTLIHQNLKICLNDINPRNILYKRVGEYGYQLVFSDFGIATRYADEECMKVDRDNLKELITYFNVL